MTRTVGKYRVLKSLAAGGMAEIFLAKLRGPEGFEKIVVVKQILPHLSKNSDFTRMFLDEARLAAQLSHPNIVQIFELGIDQPTGSYFIAMEYIHGENFRQLGKEALARQQPLPVEFAAKMIGQSAEGLYYAHTKTDAMGKALNVVHRDISPQNLLLSFDGLAKVVDFGIAKASTQLVETQAGVLKGKYAYMSPEQCRGSPLDGRSDLFALGICLWELLTNKGLYRQPNELMIMKAIVEDSPPAPSTIRADIPPELDAIVMKSLAKRPKDRFQDGMELSYAIEEWLRSNKRIVSPVHLGGYMRTLFADRLEEWAKLQEKMKAGEVGDDLFEEIPSEIVGGGFRHSSSQSQQVGGGRLNTGVGSRPTPAQARASGMTPPPTPAGGGQLHSQGAQPLEFANAPRGMPLPRPAGMNRTGTGVPAQTMVRGAGSFPNTPPPPESQGSKLPMIAGGLLVALLVLGGGAFAFRHFAGAPSEPGVVEGGDPTAAGPKVAKLLVTSTPGVAEVKLDGRKRCQTPCRLEDIEAERKILVEVSLEGYQLYTTDLLLRPGEEARLAVPLVSRGSPPVKTPSTIEVPPTNPPPASIAASLLVESNPPGAFVKLDGVTMGRAPLTLTTLGLGRKHTVEVDLPGHQTWSRELMGAEKADKVLAKLERSGRPVASAGGRPEKPPDKPPVASSGPQEGTLQITADANAAIFVDGRKVGNGAAIVTVSVGAHAVKAVAGSEETATSVTVAAGGTTKQHLKIAAAAAAPAASDAKGRLSVTMKGGWVEVWVNDVPMGQTPLAMEYPAGTYKVRLKNKELDIDESQSVTIKPGETSRIAKSFGG